MDLEHDRQAALARSWIGACHTRSDEAAAGLQQDVVGEIGRIGQGAACMLTLQGTHPSVGAWCEGALARQLLDAVGTRQRHHSTQLGNTVS